MFNFNFYEGIFWICLGLVLFIVAYKQAPENTQKLSLIAGILFLTFGLSDFVEMNFIILPWWLWLWKGINLVGLVAVLGVYFKTEKNNFKS